jgi:cytochrome P450
VTSAAETSHRLSGEDPTITSCPVKPYEFMAGGRQPYDGFRLFDGLREGCPAFRSEEAQGYYVLTTMDLIVEGLQHPELFSSSGTNPIEPVPAAKRVPLHLDPPEHAVWRRLMGPLFSPGRVLTLEGRVRARCVGLVDAIVARGPGQVDFLNEFARQFPSRVFLEIMGLPDENLDQFMAWAARILHEGEADDPNRTDSVQAMFEVRNYFQEIINERRATPDIERNDILSEALTWQIQGANIPDDDMLSFCLLLFLGGLDTVTSQLTYIFLHLATHEHDRSRLRAEPALVPKAVEEFLRVYPVVQLGRKVVRDFDFHGLSLKAGDMVQFPLAAAGRDPNQYERATEFDLDREVTRHVSFGAGPHRCIGSHLARKELQIALEVWHERMPNYTIAEGFVLSEHAGSVFALDELTLNWEDK